MAKRRHTPEQVSAVAFIIFMGVSCLRIYSNFNNDLIPLTQPIACV